MKKVHVLIDSPGFGGSEINLMRVLDMLATQPYRIHVYCNPAVDSRLLTHFKTNQISYSFDYTPNKQTYLLLGLLRIWRKCLFGQNIIFVVWAHHLNSSRWAQLGLALARRRFILVEQLVPAQKEEVVRARLTLPIKKIVAARASRIILNGISQIPQYKQLLGLPEQIPQIIAIPNTRKIARINAQVKAWAQNKTELKARYGIPTGLTIICIARLAAQKAQIDLLKALALLLQKQQAPNLVLVGTGEDEQYLKAKVEELKLPRVFFVGEHADVTPWLALADVFVLPSLSEGLPGGLIEALAAGLACVATDIPGNHELVIHEKTGLLVPPNAPSALAEALDKLLGNDQLRLQLASNGVQHVQAHYDEQSEQAAWSNMFAEWLQ